MPSYNTPPLSRISLTTQLLRATRHPPPSTRCISAFTGVINTPHLFLRAACHPPASTRYISAFTSVLNVPRFFPSLFGPALYPPSSFLEISLSLAHSLLMKTIFENNKAGGWIWTHSAPSPTQEWYHDPCPICFKVFPSARGARRHISHHGFKLSWVCTYPNCKTQISSLQDMRDHVYRHTRTRPYICNALDCTFDYVRKKELKDHTIYDHKIAIGSWELTQEQRDTVDVANKRADGYIAQILLLDNDGLRKAKNFLDTTTATYHKAKAAFEEATRALAGASAAYSAAAASSPAANSSPATDSSPAAASCDASDGQDKVPPQLTTQPLQSPRPSKRRKPNGVSQNTPLTAARHPGGPTATSMQDASFLPVPPPGMELLLPDIKAGRLLRKTTHTSPPGTELSLPDIRAGRPPRKTRHTQQSSLGMELLLLGTPIMHGNLQPSPHLNRDIIAPTTILKCIQNQCTYQ